MNRVEFMQQLERLLMDIPEHDRLDAIAYYNDYFDEAGIENEAQVIRELGSPEKVATTIKMDLNASGNTEAEYTEHGYDDGRDANHINTPAKQENTSKNKKQKRDFPLALIIILIIFASPILVGVGGGAFGVIIGILATIFGIVIAAVVTVLALAIAMLACGIACLVAGAACIVVGLVRAVTSGVEGLLFVGVGGIVFALGILFTVLFVWCAFKWLPALFRWTIDLIQRLFSRKERRSKA
ncbi:MAG: hypothetical protein IKB01_05150 [Lachnospiraceae bacterium]|nr:hypothetical protein [Lachnospiraceae bacterium]